MNNDREARIERRLLRQVGDLPALQAVPVDPPLQRSQFAGDTLEQRRLAGAVGADDGQQTAGSDFAAQVVHGWMPVVAERQVVKADLHFGGSWREWVKRSGSVQSSAQKTVIHSSSSAAMAHNRRVAALLQSTGSSFGMLAKGVEWVGMDIRESCRQE
jgi:hypothetical protein